MTEAEWQASDDADKLLDLLTDDGVHLLPMRKSRLLSVAICRRIWPLLSDARSRKAVECTEQYADGLVTESEWCAAYDEAFDVEAELAEHPERAVNMQIEALGRAANAAACTAHEDDLPAGTVQEAVAAAEAAGIVSEPSAQADLVRDIFGNPIRPVTLNPAWRTSDLLALAKGIYDERAFDRLPILADSLQDAGCDSDDILNHCRGSGPHVRGCWVVDLVLGKE